MQYFTLHSKDPALGVAITAFRRNGQGGALTSITADNVDLTKVLLCKRGKQPAKGVWCFPGGRLELGETIVDAAIREFKEETTLDVRFSLISLIVVAYSNQPSAQLTPFSSAYPVFCITESITYNDQNPSVVDFHYILAHVLGTVSAVSTGVPTDDIDELEWVTVDSIISGEFEQCRPLVAKTTMVLQKAIETIRTDRQI